MEIKSQMKTVNYIFEILNGKNIRGKRDSARAQLQRIKLKHKHTKIIAINRVSNKHTFVLTYIIHNLRTIRI